MRSREKEQIVVLMLIGYGNRIPTQQEVYNLFNATYLDLPQINQSSVRKIERKYIKFYHPRDASKNRLK